MGDCKHEPNSEGVKEVTVKYYGEDVVVLAAICKHCGVIFVVDPDGR